MQYKLVLSEEAIETYELISTQIAERWGERHLTNFKNRVSFALNTLEKSPYLYPYMSTEELNIRKFIFHKNCSILYKVDSQLVYILCFWDNRQQPVF